jgi:hydrogenase maturation protease
MAVGPVYPKIAIVGLGNVLLSDDGVGVHAVRELQKAPPAGVAVVEVGTRALQAQDVLEYADVVVAIDVVQAGDRPGSIYRFDADDGETQRPYSLHDLGIIGVLRLMPQDSRPAVIIIGVEPEIIDYGMQLSPTLQAVLSRVVETARKVVEEIRENKLSHVNVAPAALPRRGRHPSGRFIA